MEELEFEPVTEILLWDRPGFVSDLSFPDGHGQGGVFVILMPAELWVLVSATHKAGPTWPAGRRGGPQHLIICKQAVGTVLPNLGLPVAPTSTQGL